MAALGAWAQNKTAQDYFHEGAQLYVFDKKQQAVQAVEEGLRVLPNDEQLKELYKLLLKEKQQQQQQNQQDQQNQDQQNQEQQQQDQQSSQNQNEQNQQQQQDQPRNMSKEEIDRMLEALRQQEEKLQEKVQKKKHKGERAKTEKDW